MTRWVGSATDVINTSVAAGCEGTLGVLKQQPME